MGPWPFVLMLITVTSAGLLAWHQVTRIDRQVQCERWRRQPQSHPWICPGRAGHSGRGRYRSANVIGPVYVH
jgi:hypothetical protein